MNAIKQNPFATDEGGGEDPSEAGPPAGADQCFCKLEGKVNSLITDVLPKWHVKVNAAT